MSQEEGPNTPARSSSRVSLVLRLGLAFGLFGVVLYLVPIKDRVTWERVLGEGEVVGYLEHESGAGVVAFHADDGRGLRLHGRASDEDDEIEGWIWQRVEFHEAGQPWRDEAITDEDRVILAKQPEQGLLTTLKNLDPLPFCAAILCYFLAASISFHRWHVLLKAVNVEAHPLRVLKLGFFGLFFSNILPGMTGGDLIKAVYVARDHREQRPEAVFSVIVDRAIGLFGLALLCAGVLSFHLDEFGDIALTVFGIVAVMVLASCVLFSRRLRSLVHFESIISKLPGSAIFQKLDKAVLLYRDAPGQIIYAVVTSLVVHGFVLTSIGMVGVSLSLPISSFAMYYALAPLPLIIQSVPLFPAGIGVGEWAFVYFFSTKTGLVVGQMALALALSYRAVQLVISLIGGLLLLFDRDRKSLASEMETVGVE